MKVEDLKKAIALCEEYPSEMLQLFKISTVMQTMKKLYGEDILFPFIDQVKYLATIPKPKDQMVTEISVDSGNIMLADPKNILGKENLHIRKKILNDLNKIDDQHIPYPEGHAGLGMVLRLNAGAYRIYRNDREIKIVEQ